jgi:hypothetical protein
MFAFVDETGNTGHNIFDPAQPQFVTAALVTRANFDALYAGTIAELATSVGVKALHANVMGLEKLEAIAPKLQHLLKKADARFVLSVVEKRYLAVTKIIDYIFDSGENLAVRWQSYNIRPLRLLLVFKVAHLVDVPLAQEFWGALMEPKKADTYNRFREACRTLLGRVGHLPDAGSREVVSEAVQWAIDNTDQLTLHADNKEARYGHLPNMVGFRSLIDGIEAQSRKWGKGVKVIVHDEQTQFERNLKNWHEMYSNASDETIYWPGEEPHSLRAVGGSKLVMSRHHDSPGIQVVDTILWLNKRRVDEKPFGEATADLLHSALKKTWHYELSFKHVGAQLKEQLDRVNIAPLSQEQIERGAAMQKHEREARAAALAEFEQGKLGASEIERGGYGVTYHEPTTAMLFPKPAKPE